MRGESREPFLLLSRTAAKRTHRAVSTGFGNSGLAGPVNSVALLLRVSLNFCVSWSEKASAFSQLKFRGWISRTEYGTISTFTFAVFFISIHLPVGFLIVEFWTGSCMGVRVGGRDFCGKGTALAVENYKETDFSGCRALYLSDHMQRDLYS